MANVLLITVLTAEYSIPREVRTRPFFIWISKQFWLKSIHSVILFFGVASLTLRQSYHCHSGNEVKLNDMDENQLVSKHKKIKAVCIILRIYSILHVCSRHVYALSLLKSWNNVKAITAKLLVKSKHSAWHILSHDHLVCQCKLLYSNRTQLI